MKKIILALAGGILLFTACKKNRNCVCTDIDDGTQDIEIIVNSKKSDAKNICTSWSNSGQSCELQ